MSPHKARSARPGTRICRCRPSCHAPRSQRTRYRHYKRVVEEGDDSDFQSSVTDDLDRSSDGGDSTEDQFASHPAHDDHSNSSHQADIITNDLTFDQPPCSRSISPSLDNELHWLYGDDNMAAEDDMSEDDLTDQLDRLSTLPSRVLQYQPDSSCSDSDPADDSDNSEPDESGDHLPFDYRKGLDELKTELDLYLANDARKDTAQFGRLYFYIIGGSHSCLLSTLQVFQN